MDNISNAASSLMLANSNDLVAPPCLDSPMNLDHHETVLGDLPIQTPETTLTPLSEITNSEFMEEIFVGLQPDERPYVVQVFGDDILKKPNFSGQSWTPENDLTSKNCNHYFTLSTYLPKNDVYKRTKEQFFRAYGIYFDDIGTKGNGWGRLNGCRPSYVIETSPGNFQIGYLFDHPIENLSEVERLVDTAVSAGLGDPGAKGPSSRLGRLPCAINGKYKPYFHCKLVEWHPELKYSIDQIYEGLSLERIFSTKNTPQLDASVKSDLFLATNVYSPRALENPVITALRQQGLYKHALNDRKHEITCSWVHEHTGRKDSGTAYFEPTELLPYGAFKCLHGHCAERKLFDFLKEIDVSWVAAKHKATITLIAGEFNNIVDAAEIEIKNTGNFYQRSGLICHVVTDPGSNLTSIKALNYSDLNRALSKSVHWAQYSSLSQSLKIVDPSQKHVNSLHSSGSYSHLPVIQGIARQPYLRSDESLVTTTGYDSVTGMYGVFDAAKFSVPECPSREVAIAAVEEFKLLLEEFSFAQPHDLSAAIAMILTAAIRTSLPVAPMGHIKASQISSGKSYLCELIGLFAGAAKPSAYAFPKTDEECSKLFLAALFEAPSALIFDNLTSDILPFNSLCSALTSEYMSGRILGVSQIRTVSTRTLLLSSGNNVDPVRDMVRRVLTITLDPRVESPATRRFSGNPFNLVSVNREQYVSLALTIVRAYIFAGCPIQKNLKALSSFEQWTKLVRSPLVWLGLLDPATALFETIENDPEKEVLRRLMQSLLGTFKTNHISVSDIVARVETSISSGLNSDLAEVVREIAEQSGKISRRSLGKWIARHQNIMVDGYIISKSSSSGGSLRWCIVQKIIPDVKVDSEFANSDAMSFLTINDKSSTATRFND